METEKVKRHVRNYEKVRKQIIAYYDRRRKEVELSLEQAKYFLERVRKGEKGLVWPTSQHGVTEDDCIGQISRMEELLRPPYRGKPRKHTILQWRQLDLDRLDAADRAPVFTGLKAKVEWKRSRTWGHNPVAECWVFGAGPAIYTMKGSDGRPLAKSDGKPYLHTIHYAVGKASGYGYDKLSAAVEDGISCPTIDRLVIENGKCWECYAVDGKKSLPHLSISGKGVETLRALFKAYGEKPPIPGFEWNWEQGKNWDFIEVKPKGKTS